MAFYLSSPLLQTALISSQRPRRQTAMACTNAGFSHRLFRRNLPSRPRRLSVRSSSSAGGGGEDQAVKEVERLLKERQKAELASRIASGEFTVQQPGFAPLTHFRPFISNCCFPESMTDLDLSSQVKLGSCGEEWAFQAGAGGGVLRGAAVGMGRRGRRRRVSGNPTGERFNKCRHW